MKEIRTLLLKPAVKTAVLGLLTVIFGILCNVVVGSHKFYLWIILIAFVLLDIIVLIAYTKAERNLEKELQDITTKQQNTNKEKEDLIYTIEAFSKAMQGIATTCMFCAKNANIQIHEIIDKKRIDCKAWNFDLASDTVCESIYNNIIEQLGIAKANDGIVDVEIGYVKLLEKDQNEFSEPKICLCGHYHPTRNGPTILGKERAIEKDGYHDSELFYYASDQPDIQLNPDAVMTVLKKCDGKDYSQYLGIPVFCSTHKKNSKMVGLLEIICHGDSVLSNDINQIQKLANTFFAPYANLLLLLYKMDKALRAQPKK